MSKQLSELTMVRISQWGLLIKAANESSLSRAEWCKTNGISENAFYYWQRKVRKYALDAIKSSKESSCDGSNNNNTPDFFEISLSEPERPLPQTHNIQRSSVMSIEDKHSDSGIILRTGSYEISVSDRFSRESLAAVLEVINHV